MPFGRKSLKLPLVLAVQVFRSKVRSAETGRWEEEDDTTRGLAEGQFPELYSLMTKAMSSTIKMEDLF